MRFLALLAGLVSFVHRRPIALLPRAVSGRIALRADEDSPLPGSGRSAGIALGGRYPTWRANLGDRRAASAVFRQ
jgi:hypothetical protein